MAKKKVQDKGLTYPVEEHEHLLVASIDKEIDEGSSIKLIFTDTNGAVGFVRIAKKRWAKVKGDDENE